MAGLVQTALDFLGIGTSGSASGSASGSGSGSGSAGPAATGMAERAEPSAAPAALPAEPVPGSALQRHPQANREALLQGRPVAYRLERGRRRTVGFTVCAQGLSVRAPAWLPLQHIDEALVGKAGWILAKLADAEVRRDRQEATRIVWGEGAVFPLRGVPTVVRLGARRGAQGLRAEAAEGATGTGGAGVALWLALPADAPAEQVGEAVRAWMCREARVDFTARLERYAAQMGVRWTRLSLTDARTRWGSASSSGAIRLHWRLMHFRPEVIDYVVVHELAHLRHMDHSARFWAVVGGVLPGYAGLRAELRADHIPRW